MEYLLIMFLVIVTIFLGKVGTRFGFSEVVGQLFSGIILGSSIFNIVQSSNLIHLIAEIGIFLLMLNSGLESDLKEMKRYIKASSLIAVMGVLLPLITFPIAFLLLGYNIQTSIFAGVVFSATSISITLAVLSEQKKLATAIGAIILSAAVIDDIIALFAVTLFSVLVGGGALGINSILPLLAFALGILLRKYNFSDKIGVISTKMGNSFFYPVFFGSIGLEIVIQGLGDKITAIIIFSILAIVTKFVGSLWGAKISGLDTRVSSAVGAGMISRGEMALVIIQIGISSHIIDDYTSAEFIVAVIVSTIVAPIIMKPLFKKI